jgi:LPS export ABC transporter protein LptC
MSGCQRKDPKPVVPKPVEPKPKVDVGFDFKGVRLEMNDEQGRPVYRIKSPASSGSSGAQAATLTNTTVTLYHEGEPDTIVTAPQTTVKAETKDIVMTGGVTAKSPKQRQMFHVDRLVWNAGTRRYVGTGNVRYARPPVEIRGATITGTTPIKTFHMDGGIAMTVKP